MDRQERAIYEAIESLDPFALADELDARGPEALDRRCRMAGEQPRAPIILAAELGSIDCLKLLIERGARLDVVDVNLSQRPLATVAAARGHADCLRVLIEAGVDIEATDGYGYGPAGWAAREGRVECLRVLADADAVLAGAELEGSSPAFLAASAGRLDCLAFLAERGVDVFEPDHCGATPLESAKANGHDHCVAFLEALALRQGLAKTPQAPSPSVRL